MSKAEKRRILESRIAWKERELAEARIELRIFNKPKWADHFSDDLWEAFVRHDLNSRAEIKAAFENEKLTFLTDKQRELIKQWLSVELFKGRQTKN